MASQRQQRLSPLHDRVLIEPVRDTDERVGSLIVPNLTNEQPQVGRVLAVGPGRVSDHGMTLHAPCSVGDLVVYGRYSGSEVTLGRTSEPLLILRSEDLLAVLEEVGGGEGE